MSGTDFLLMSDGLLISFWMIVIFEQGMRDFLNLDKANFLGFMLGFGAFTASFICLAFTIELLRLV